MREPNDEPNGKRKRRRRPILRPLHLQWPQTPAEMKNRRILHLQHLQLHLHLRCHQQQQHLRKLLRQANKLSPHLRSTCRRWPKPCCSNC